MSSIFKEMFENSNINQSSQESSPTHDMYHTVSKNWDKKTMDQVLEIARLFNALNDRELQQYTLRTLNKSLKPIEIDLSKPKLTFDETCQYCQITRRTLNNWINKGVIKGEKIGKYWQFDIDEVERIKIKKNK